QAMMLPLAFDHPEDRACFVARLCEPGETLEMYADLFDFRLLDIKKREAAGVCRVRLPLLIAHFGKRCLLKYAADCDLASGLVLDHLIPLASNVPAKCRGVGTSRSPSGALIKTPSQPFGSNGARNLILACVNCNGFKM